MTKHKTFQQLYTVLLNFIKLNKRIPSSSSTDKEEKRLGNWCYQLRKKYRLKTLGQDKIDQLQKINIWFWNKQDFNKNKCFKELNLLNMGIPRVFSIQSCTKPPPYNFCMCMELACRH